MHAFRLSCLAICLSFILVLGCTACQATTAPIVTVPQSIPLESGFSADGVVDIAVDNHGDVHVVWSEYNQSVGRIAYAYLIGGKIVNQFSINPPPNTGYVAPQVVVDSNGLVYISWTKKDYSITTITYCFAKFTHNATNAPDCQPIDNTPLQNPYSDCIAHLVVRGQIVYSAFLTDQDDSEGGEVLKLRRLDVDSPVIATGLRSTAKVNLVNFLDLALSPQGEVHLAATIQPDVFQPILNPSYPPQLIYLRYSPSEGLFSKTILASSSGYWLSSPSISIDDSDNYAYIAITENSQSSSTLRFFSGINGQMTSSQPLTYPGLKEYSDWSNIGQPALVIIPHNENYPGPHLVFSASNNKTASLIEIWELSISASPQILQVTSTNISSNYMFGPRAILVTDGGHSSVLKFWRERTSHWDCLNVWYHYATTVRNLPTNGMFNCYLENSALDGNGAYAAAIWLDADVPGSGHLVPWVAVNTKITNSIYLPAISN